MRPLDTARDHDGLPITTKLEERVSKAIAAVATLFFALVAAWEIGGPIPAGHYASSASMGIIAENMWRWHILAPVWEYTATRPPPSLYYCHHPWGIFWVTALFFKIFGRHDFVCRLAPVLLSAATPPLLYAIGRSVWRPASGAIAALSFVVLPIALSFAAFNALEVPVMAWTLLGLFGWVRFLATWRRKYAVIAWVGFLFAAHADWQSYVLIAELLLFAFARFVVLRRAGFGAPKGWSYVATWLAIALTTFVSGMAYLVIFFKVGKLNDLFGSYDMRAAGNNVSLRAALEARRYWIELCFTPVAVVLGKVAAIACALRVIFVRREEETIPLIYLGMAAFQYIVFKQGADIHVFWPHTFAAYFALGMGALLATITPLAARLLRLRASMSTVAFDRAPLVILGLFAIPLAFVLRDGLPALVYAHRTGGRFDERGALIDSDGAATAFLHWVSDRTPLDQKVDLHEGMKPTWAQVWALGGRVVGLYAPLPRSAGPEPVTAPYLVDTRFLLDGAQADLALRYGVTAVGSFWQINRTEVAPIEAFAIRESEPSFLRWYFVSGTEPAREIVPDPWLTWELRAHFDQEAEPFDAAPETLDHLRIQHNMAVTRGDTDRAAKIAKDLEDDLTPVHVAFDDGTELVGVRYIEGAQPELLLLLRAGGPTAKDVQLTVKSKVTAPARLSTTMMDPGEREVGLPLAIAPERWKQGFLYADHVPIRKRPGREVFTTSFWSRRRGPFPKPLDGRKSIEVLTLR